MVTCKLRSGGPAASTWRMLHQDRHILAYPAIVRCRYFGVHGLLNLFPQSLREPEGKALNHSPDGLELAVQVHSPSVDASAQVRQGLANRHRRNRYGACQHKRLERAEQRQPFARAASC